MKFQTSIQSLLWLLLIVFSLMICGCADLESSDWRARRRAVRRLTDQKLLAKIALEDEHYWVNMAAVEELTDQALLAKVVIEKPHRDISSAAIEKLSKEELTKLSTEAEDPVVRIAAEVRLEENNWDEAFNKYSLKNVMTAIFVFDRPSTARPAIKRACERYIREGNESNIPELKNILRFHGDRSLAEVYLNCGQNDLSSEAKRWAKIHGFVISHTSGYGSRMVRWGSDKR